MTSITIVYSCYGCPLRKGTNCPQLKRPVDISIEAGKDYDCPLEQK